MNGEVKNKLALGTQHSEFLIYQAADGRIRIDVRLEDETVWLTQDHMAELFGKAKSTINEHIKNIFAEGELVEAEVMKKFGISEFQQKAHNYYNLDVIISVGYRVKSHQGTQFRNWATQRLKEYIVKGFSLNDERFKKCTTPGCHHSTQWPGTHEPCGQNQPSDGTGKSHTGIR